MIFFQIQMNSFTVKNHQGRIVACGMNCDAFDVPELKPRAKALDYVFEVLEQAKGPARYVNKRRFSAVLGFSKQRNQTSSL